MKKLYFTQLSAVLLSIALMTGCTDAGATANLAANDTAGSADAAAAAADAASLEIPEKAAYDEEELAADWQEETAATIALDGSSAAVEGEGVAAANGTVTITKAGTYVLSGKLDGQVVVNVTKEDKVRLVLSGAEITNASGPAVDVKEADKVIVTLAEGTRNVISDGEAYADTSEDAPNAAFYSKADLTVNGKGTLIVNGSYNDGLTSKDDLKIVEGTIEVHAADDGLLGRDLVAVKGGTLTIEAGGDGIKTTNEEESGKGNVVIEGGTFNINAGSDGVQSAVSVRIDGGSFDIVSGGGSANGEVHAEQQPGRGMRPGAAPDRSGTGADAAVPEQSAETGTDKPSQKGLKAAAVLAVYGGTFAIDAADDALHSNGSILVNAGELKLSSGDDGIHADASVTIEGGKIDILKSYEGIEGSVVTIADGEINVVADDDGINVAGGNDGSAAEEGPGDKFAASGSYLLAIKGGDITVNAAGDGLDSNGAIEMSGGNVLVYGPTANGNGALDYDGTFNITGGFLAAAGSAGMAEAPSDTSSQYSILMTYPETQAAGTTVVLKDSEGKAVATVTPAKAYQTIVISSPDLKQGASYTLYAGDTKIVDFEIASTVTWLNESGVTEAGSGGQGMGGGMRPGRGDRPMSGGGPQGNGTMPGGSPQGNGTMPGGGPQSGQAAPGSGPQSGQ